MPVDVKGEKNGPNQGNQRSVLLKQRKLNSQRVIGEVVVDTYLIDLSQDLSGGTYPIEVGLYLPHNGQRLLVTMPGLRDNDVLYLWPLEIE